MTVHVRRPRPGAAAIAARIVLGLAALAALLAVAAWLAFRLSPWPAALLVRRTFDRGAAETALALLPHVPPGVASHLDEPYDPVDPDAKLDVYYPAAVESTSRVLPTVLWVHGGGWVSGDKSQVGSYLKVIAARGYTTISIGYTIAPEKHYPTPVRQANAALGYVVKNAARLHVDVTRLVLAGDSGGAHIAAQLANAIAVPAYADTLGIEPALERPRLRGTLLFCGAYDARSLRLDGEFGRFLRTVLWAYLGRRDFASAPLFPTFSVIEFVTREFPPSFVTAGNGDPLAPQSQAFAAALAGKGVRVDTLFFPADRAPALPHEYQFDLDTEAGRLALDRATSFLGGLKAAR